MTPEDQSVTLEAGGTMAETIQSIRDGGGWQAIFRALKQDPDRLFRETCGAMFFVEGEPPTMFEFWLAGFVSGLATQAEFEPPKTHPPGGYPGAGEPIERN